MSTRIFIQNNSKFSFELLDADGTSYAFIITSQQYSLNLNFSETFEKRYDLKITPADAESGGSAQPPISFWLTVGGELSRVETNGHALRVSLRALTPHQPDLLNYIVLDHFGRRRQGDQVIPH